MFADVETFGFFLFGDTNAAEEGADDLPSNEAGDHGPDGVSTSAQGLDAELLNATTNEKAEGGAIALNVKAPRSPLKSLISP